MLDRTQPDPNLNAEDAAPSPAIAVTGPSPFDRRADRFETLGEIGRGGMGRIDSAFDHSLGRPVAIKHMLTGSTLDRMRFERETRITARLEHPGIVPVHEAGRNPDGTPYYVMRRVDGRPLADLVVEAATLADRLALIPNVLAAATERKVDPLAGVYLNRLSDLLFVLSRAANPPGDEPLWKPGGGST